MAREVIDSGKYIQVYSDGCMRIDNVVLSHPHLLAKWTPKGSEKSFYAIRPMLHVDDHGETVSIIKDSLNKLMGEKKLGRITRDNTQSVTTPTPRWTLSMKSMLTITLLTPKKTVSLKF